MTKTILAAGLLVLMVGAACRPKTEETQPAGRDDTTSTTETRGATTNVEPTPPPAANPANPATTNAAAAPTNLPPFEGELDVKVPGKASESLEYAMKGDQIRLGLSGVPGRSDKGVDAIIDTRKQKATVLLNDRKEYVEVDLGKLAKKAEQRLEQVDVQRTGKTNTIAGRSCEEWVLKDRDYHVNACVMKGAPYFDLAAVERQANFTAPAWIHKIVDAGYVPLRVTVSDAKGQSLASSEIADTSRTVDAAQFEVPKDYKKTDVSKLTAQPRK